MWSIKFITILLWITHMKALHIPKDVEILDGFEIDASPEYYPADSSASSSFEARGFIDGISKSIHGGGKNTPRRNEEGLHKTDAEVINPKAIPDNDKPEHREVTSLPVAEKQTMDSDFYKWDSYHHSSPDYNRKSYDNQDHMPEPTSGEVIRGRTPRVNFVTTPKRSGTEDDNGDLSITKIPKTKSTYDKFGPTNYDLYPSRSYDPYLRRYDRYDDHNNRHDGSSYEDYYIRRRNFDPYDSYSPRMPEYPEPYYYYPDYRYDVPEPRDYRPLYNNDIYERSASSNSYYNYKHHPTPSPYYNKRIVYYAHLPEIVRSPVTRYDQPNRHSAYSVENNKTSTTSTFGRDKKNFPSSVKN
ncbi:hypothetical protein ACFFRR_003143 [Megaselia abdita]